jgi:CRISPR-associated protein Cas5
MSVDITLLFEEPKLDASAMLVIKPLAPLSMVSCLPGAYYKTERVPTKSMLCGLFENLLGWHFSTKDRANIFKEMQKNHKKRFEKKIEKEESESGFQPLLGYYFELTPQVMIPSLKHYEDLWTQHLIGNDSRHSNGAIHYDWQLEEGREKCKNNDDEHNKFFKMYRDKFPKYYRAVPKREFIIAQGDYRLKIIINDSLLSILKNKIEENNMGYLGTSEGWVDVKLQEVKNV